MLPIQPTGGECKVRVGWTLGPTPAVPEESKVKENVRWVKPKTHGGSIV